MLPTLGEMDFPHFEGITASDFKLDDPAIQANPYPFYPLLREHAPVLRTSFGGQACWIVSRRADVDAVLMDPAIYSSRTTPLPNVLFADPPDHSRLRQMVSGRLTRAAVVGFEDRIVAFAETFMAPIVGAGEGDIVTDYAGPLTISMISLLLGIAIPHVESLRHLTQLRAEAVLAMRLGQTPSEAARRASDELAEFMSGLAAEGAHEPDGVIAALVTLLKAGELSQQEFVAYATLLFAAGHSTTTNLIANSIYMLTQRPRWLDRLRADDGFVTPFVEEVLRSRPSFHRLLRVTTEDTVLGGVPIPAGAIVRVLLASANRDPAYCDAAEAFDPDQRRRAHLSFGRGIHACLGSWLARLEASSALRVFARHVEAVVLDPDRPPVPLTGGTFNEFGFEHLPIRVTAGQE